MEKAACHQRTIAIAVGGTAGHLHTAIAIAQQYSESVPGCNIYFISEPSDIARKVLQKQWPGMELSSAPWMRTGWFGRLKALYLLATGFLKARTYLKKKQVDLVIGCGGYCSVATVLAARSVGITCVLHEANAVAGRANRLLARFCGRLYLAWPQTLKHNETLVTGVPIRREILQDAVNTDNTRSQSYRIFIVGGSLGSQFLNQKAPELAAALAEQGLALDITHQVGQYSPDSVIQTYKTLGIKARVISFVEDMGEAYGQADFVICCSGAITLAELSLFAVPALLVPLKEASDDHQNANAQAYLGALATLNRHKTTKIPMRYTTEVQWQTQILADEIAELLTDTDSNNAGSQLIHQLHRPDAGLELVKDCEKLLDSA